MTYREREVLTVRPSFDGIQLAQLDDFTYEAEGPGSATPWKATTTTRRRVTFNFLLDGQGEIAEFRRFVAAHAGRRLAFWVPLYANDYMLEADAALAASVLNVKDVNFADAFAAGDQWKHIACVTVEDIGCYGVASCGTWAGGETLTLDATLAAAAPKASTVVCPLMLARLQDDALSYEYLSEEVARVSVAFLETPRECPPPLPGDLAPSAHSAPVWLYRFTLAGPVVHRIAAYATDFVDASVYTWAKANVTHNPLRQSSEVLGQELSIRIRTDDPDHWLRPYLDRYMALPIAVDLYRTDAGNPAVDQLDPEFSGSVTSINFREKGVIEVVVSSMFRFAERPIPRVVVQRHCNHQLFSVGCGLVEAAWETVGTVTAIDGSDAPYVTSAGFSAKVAATSDPYWFALGKVTIGTEVRICTGIDLANPDRLYLNSPFRQPISIGDTVKATPGDDHRIGTCANKFSNSDRFLGFPYMPSSNPQFSALEIPKPTGGKK